MTCKCSSPAEHQERAESRSAEYARADERKRLASSPDAKNFTVDDGEVIGPHLVLKVRYPNCTLCAYEGVKVMVFLDMSFKEAIKWKRIDPHFRDPKLKGAVTDAPSPAARFPASKEGWEDAIDYARAKERQKKL
jgi:hypothetical protein